jgi:hypothetical protein
MDLLSFQDIKKNNKKKKALILGCGPSLSALSQEKLEEMSSEFLIITIKHSYEFFWEKSDFHFFNCNNICIYPRFNSKFICCSPTPLDRGRLGPWKHQEIDAFFHMKHPRTRLCDFDKIEEFFEESNMGKFLGPGIMVEIVLPFVYNLGVKEIVTAGWDYHKNDGEIEHYYPEERRKKFANPAAVPYRGENEESIKNSGRINSFFEEQGVKLSCLESEKCFLHNSIKRILI